MAIKALKCPNCGGIIEQFDETMKKGFCPYCDSIILDVQEKQVEFIQFINKFQVEGISTIENLLLRAQQYLDTNEFNKAEEYANKILDLDINNQKANRILELTQVVYINGANVSLMKIQECIDYSRISKSTAIKNFRIATGFGLEDSLNFFDTACKYKKITRLDFDNILRELKIKSKNYFVLKDK